MNPWLDPEVTLQQAKLVAHQLAEKPVPVHFTTFVDALRALDFGTVLEVGCGVGHGSALAEIAGIRSGSYSGIDISERAIAIARELYPDCMWYCVDAKTLPTFDKRDIVIDGSCVLHIEDWRSHLAALCGVSKDAVILHRLPIHVDGQPTTTATTTQGYGQTFPAWRFAGGEVADEMRKHGFEMTEARMAHGDSATLTFRRVDR